MRATVTTTSTDLRSLLSTAGYDTGIIEDNRIKQNNNNNAYGVYISVPSGGSAVYFENFYEVDASTPTSVAIAADSDFSLDVSDIGNFNLAVASGTQVIDVVIT